MEITIGGLIATLSLAGVFFVIAVLLILWVIDLLVCFGLGKTKTTLLSLTFASSMTLLYAVSISRLAKPIAIWFSGG